MIDADVDAIILIAGSSTAPGRVVADACAKGIAIINFDSLVDTDQVTAKVNTDSAQWGAGANLADRRRSAARARSSSSTGRPASRSATTGARAPNRSSRPTRTSRSSPRPTRAYNVAPAQEAVTSLLFANPRSTAILSLGGALSAGAILAFDKQGRPLVPITGENARQFLELWKEKKLKSWATMQPNWLGAFATYAAVQALRARTCRPSSRSRCRSSTTPTSTVPRQGQGLPGGRLYLLALRPEAVRQAAGWPKK